MKYVYIVVNSGDYYDHVVATLMFASERLAEDWCSAEAGRIGLNRKLQFAWNNDVSYVNITRQEVILWSHRNRY